MIIVQLPEISSMKSNFSIGSNKDPIVSPDNIPTANHIVLRNDTKLKAEQSINIG